MNYVISELHKVDYKKIGLEDFGKPGNYIFVKYPDGQDNIVHLKPKKN